VLALVSLLSRVGFLSFIALAAFAQNQADEDFHVYTDAPRLLLTKQRLRLLQRERERQSMRWQQFDALISGGAPMPEPGFAWALYFQVSRNPAAGGKAIEWALSNAGNDLRQVALVFDWCGPSMNETQATRLAAKIAKAIAAIPSPDDFRGHAARSLAVIAIADRLPDHGEALLRSEIDSWWRGPIRKRIESGRALPREQMYWVYEMFNAVRDNLRIDLRESAPEYFKSLPVDHLSSHYPAPLDAPENEYRVPVYVRDGEPDPNVAAMSRAAELAMVAYDDNAAESQYLQGWLMQDRFVMRGALGSVYEFLWANPYQPGLSYFQTPLVFHDDFTGHVFARTSWDEDATWVGYFDGHLQMFRDGHVETLRPGAATKPVHIGDALLLSADNHDTSRFRANAEAVFVLNLEPRAVYDVEVDDQELWECTTDAGGTLVLSFPEGADAGVRIHRRN
jgi:hypothetical protein